MTRIVDLRGLTEDELQARINDLIYMLIDHRIAKGKYKPEEREQKFAEMQATLERLEMKHVRPDKKLQ